MDFKLLRIISTIRLATPPLSIWTVGLASALVLHAQLPYPKGGVVLGQRWNSLRGTKAGALCLDPETWEMKQDQGGDAKSEIRYVSDESSYSSFLEIDASAHLQVSATAKFVRDSLQKQSRELWVARTAIHKGITQLAPRPDRPAIALRQEYKKMSPAQMYQSCGDSYVSAIEKGGELLISHSLYGRTAKENQQIAAAIKASYVGGAAAASVKSKLENFESNTTLNVTYVRVGGIDEKLGHGLQELRQDMKTFPAWVKTSASELRIFISPYSSLPGSTEPTVTFNGKSDAFHEFLKIIQLQRILTEIQGHPKRFILDAVASMQVDLRLMDDQVTQHIQLLQSAIIACQGHAARGQSHSCAVDAIDDYAYRSRLPPRRWSFDADLQLRDAEREMQGLDVKYNGKQALAEPARTKAIDDRRKDLRTRLYPEQYRRAVLDQWIQPVLEARRQQFPQRDVISASRLQVLENTIK